MIIDYLRYIPRSIKESQRSGRDKDASTVFYSAIIHLYPLKRTPTVSKNKAQFIDLICEDQVKKFHHHKPVVILVLQITFGHPAFVIVIADDIDIFVMLMHFCYQDP